LNSNGFKQSYGQNLSGNNSLEMQLTTQYSKKNNDIDNKKVNIKLKYS
jgi:hypothetical protein